MTIKPDFLILGSGFCNKGLLLSCISFLKTYHVRGVPEPTGEKLYPGRSFPITGIMECKRTINFLTFRKNS